MTQQSRTYRWDSPYDWLAETARKWSKAELYDALTNLASKVDSDTLQDEYQAEMDDDGYFDVEGEDDQT